MANETVRTKAGDTLANLVYPGGSGDALANVLRDASKIVVLTQAAYDALAVKDPNIIYLVTA